MRLHEYVIYTVMMLALVLMAIAHPPAALPILAGCVGFLGDLILAELRKR